MPRSRILLAAILAGAVATVLPSLNTGFIIDDISQMERLDRTGWDLALWNFSSPNPAAAHAAKVRSGVVSWTEPVWDITGVALFRPLSSLVYSAAYAVVGRNARLLHSFVLLLW